jgi:hypothetical protein
MPSEGIAPLLIRLLTLFWVSFVIEPSDTFVNLDDSDFFFKVYLKFISGIINKPGFSLWEHLFIKGYLGSGVLKILEVGSFFVFPK